jgi:hypothetical protein
MAMARFGAIAHLAGDLSALVHELQKERGMSSGFLGSKGHDFAGEIGGQRSATDGPLAKVRGEMAPLEQAATGDLAMALTAARTELDRLAPRRWTGWPSRSTRWSPVTPTPSPACSTSFHPWPV